ncbi:prepronociceptin [Kryptolebias marmoratus]|uniref:Prepronociceptin-like n=1 Tax=Kryptolebias marmoratus TaxID=37003 RepID=A0A3Q2ZC43_KRYMA|nr:prepronociceptin [Kryptolebias marmoratus]XP_024863736.1 prepronociceptin [Kryptolebias marmoratus]
MKTVVALLLLCLCDPGRSDCQGDCLTCSHILPRQLNFNSMVCLFECTENVSPSFTWDLCRKALPSSTSSLDSNMRKRSQEEADVLLPEEEEQMEGDLLSPTALQKLDHVTRALGLNQKGLSGSQLSAVYNSQNALSLENEYEEEEAQQEDGDADVGAREQGDQLLSVSKRFGGFYKGRHGYRKLTSPGKSYQKRYGGFIGIRKSARKWNNQKRFSEFLKQYLGMTPRASEFNSVSGDLTQQNEV